MFVRIERNPIRTAIGIIAYLWKELVYTSVIATCVYLLYDFGGLRVLGLGSAIPIGVVGTALAIFLGFRNNSAYDRWWEGRKIWGGIVNISRTFGAQVMTYVTDSHVKEPSTPPDLQAIHKELIYRHIAYINALRLHLRQQHDQYETTLAPFLDEDELQALLQKRNKATQVNFNQSQRLKAILKDNLIEDFRLYEMMHTIETLYELQGKCERIKNTPFPVYYSMFTRLILYIFVLFLPLSVISSFDTLSVKLGMALTWLVIPVSVLACFVLSVIERTARTSENPFENYYGDVPMSGLCHTIEIDLREMLGETELPPNTTQEEPRVGFYVIR